VTMSELKKLLPEYPVSKNTTLGTIEQEAYGLHDNVFFALNDFVELAMERGYDYDDQLRDICENDPQILKDI